MRRTVFFAAVAACALAVAVAVAEGSATEQATLVVDDAVVQCPNAEFTSIQAAVDAASPGDTIRVCPGVYAESVRIDKPLTLKADPESVEAVDCFDPAPSQLGDLDPAQHVIVDGSALPLDQPALITLEDDNIILEGFVIQGAVGIPDPLDDRTWKRAIDVSGVYSGYRVHHNLIRLNTIGIQFGSSGASESRFDHNCMRENRWGLAADYRDVVNARIDHNATYGTIIFAFELFRLDYARENISFDHNWSRQDNTPYWISGSKDSRIVANTIESARIGILIQAANERLEIAGNIISDPFGTNRTGFVLQGIGFGDPGVGQLPTTDALVRDNTITGMGTPASPTGDGIVAAGPPNAPRPGLMNSQIMDNVTSDNLRDGIVLRGGNAGNVVRGNIAERNRRYGIYAQGAIGNLFAANQMFGNDVFDARDEARESNTWIGNLCLTDFPTGTICGVG